jgi:hypothetical protein
MQWDSYRRFFSVAHEIKPLALIEPQTNGSAACGRVHAQNPPATATSAEAITGCNAELAVQVKAALRAAPAVNVNPARRR